MINWHHDCRIFEGAVAFYELKIKDLWIKAVFVRTWRMTTAELLHATYF